MATKPKPVEAPKGPAKPKKAKKLTFADVREAAKGGDEAFEFYVENGKLPVG